ncbi:putative villin headpiece, villin/Gelsolin, ADF-H/Gelsolin-like domain-containing protein [Lupinus albus]|uniref:Putative villin headpiece, villin/Gelsolin, ADF-H/Gelsolin-like domain-containing protein n=1 Tax=Lupinus albus TaxID=3870 RepID=A0A6A4R6N3_LUPAL|nr:putative villin headpiece, villin/Gelsolin, ADF-H/Gelsolin-like domain-containing protein [Lupinus albus]
MSSTAKVLDPAFQGVGQRSGTEIWRIEDFQPVPLPKSNYGKFYMGDSYIILQTTQAKGGTYFYDIHFWIGKDTSQDEAGTAAIKTVELDASLGGRAVQHREIQGHESDKFLSYFKPCIIPLEGGVASGFKKPEEEEFETRLYICKGKRVVRMKQVPFARSSLNHDDVFILDTQDKIYQFNGANSNIQERAKALEVIQFLKEKYHEGKCDVAIVDDGKLDTESDSGEFWVLFGGFAPIGKKVISEDDIIPETIPAQLYSIADGEVKPLEGELSKSLLENNKCYLLDRGVEIFVWVGRVTQVEERKAACQAAEEFVASQKRPKSTRITRIIQGYETHSFKSNFDSWPSGSTNTGAEEGRGKVAALLKQQGIGLKGIAKSTPVWQINGSAKTPLAKEDIGKFYSGDCYIVLYTYHSGERKEDYYLCCWFGKDSIEDDQKMATRLANTIFNSLKGRPVQGRIFEGKEPPQFVALFQPMVVLKGGLSSGYKKFIAEKGSPDETFTTESIALIRISGTSIHNNKSVQVDAVASSLNSAECFVLQSGSTIFTWNGNQCSFEQQQLAAKVAEFLRPGVAVKHAKEGTESSAFWFAIGGKQSYTSKKVTNDIVRDPHLFTFSINKGKLQVEEVYNFSQDDLLTEDILILDTHAEVFVWIGHCVDQKEKQNAFEFGEKYIDLAASLDGLFPHVPLYKVTEGNEPCFFTTYFSWDHAKATVQGNSFQKKMTLFFGIGHVVEEKSNGSSGPRQRAEALAALSNAFNSSSETTSSMTQDRLNGLNQGGPRQRAEALAALNSAFNSSSGTKPVTPRAAGRSQGSSQRAAAVAALSQVLTAEKKKTSPDASPVASTGPTAENSTLDAKHESPHSESGGPEEVAEAKETQETSPETGSNGDSEPKQEKVEDGNDGQNNQSVFSYEQLNTKSGSVVSGIDLKRRETYLSDEEFESIFKMTKEAFSKLPRWKQDMLKKKVDLF